MSHSQLHSRRLLLSDIITDRTLLDSDAFWRAPFFVSIQKESSVFLWLVADGMTMIWRVRKSPWFWGLLYDSLHTCQVLCDSISSALIGDAGRWSSLAFLILKSGLLDWAGLAISSKRFPGLWILRRSVLIWTRPWRIPMEARAGDRHLIPCWCSRSWWFRRWTICLTSNPVATGLAIRTFTLQHDCGHGSLFRSPWANNFIGRLCSIFTFTPYDHWRKHHSIHHSGWNNIDCRGRISDIYSDCITVNEYRNMTPFKRRIYRLSKNPVVSYW